jgi:hypothetical protein
LAEGVKGSGVKEAATRRVNQKKIVAIAKDALFTHIFAPRM